MRKSAVYTLLATFLDVEKSAWINTCVMGILTGVFGAGSGQKEFTDFLDRYMSTLAVSGVKLCR